LTISDETLARLRTLSDAAEPALWTSMVEGRDHMSGDNFILTGTESDRGPDIYINEDLLPARVQYLDLVAAARTYLPILLDEIRELRAQLERSSE
jgi:hypothetical protein